jgi:hypothetical protein
MSSDLFTAPQHWFLDDDGNPTTDEQPGYTPILDRMPLREAVKLGIADKDGTPIDPKAVKKALKAKAKEE